MAHSSSSATFEYKTDKSVVCNCNRPAKIIQAWTDDNTGRRFYSCDGRKGPNGYDSCNFFRWYDVEKPYGWQHDALIGARDVMHQRKEEINNLRNKIRTLTLESESMDKNERSTVNTVVKRACEECETCEALKRDVSILNERSTVYRNVLITSSIGFSVVLGVVVGILKW